jgi:hypothetical protein
VTEQKQSLALSQQRLHNIVNYLNVLFTLRVATNGWAKIEGRIPYVADIQLIQV